MTTKLASRHLLGFGDRSSECSLNLPGLSGLAWGTVELQSASTPVCCSDRKGPKVHTSGERRRSEWMTLRWDTPEMHREAFAIMMVADIIGTRSSATTMLSLLRLQTKKIHITLVLQHAYRFTTIKETMTKWGQEVGNPLVPLLLAGSYLHTDNTLWCMQYIPRNMHMVSQRLCFVVKGSPITNRV